MSNLIYEKCVELFSSEDSEEQLQLYRNILQMINDCIKKGEESTLTEALKRAEVENKSAIFNHLNSMINLSVTTMSHNNDTDSHLFVFPIILQSQVTTLTLPAIKEMEEVLRKNFLTYNFAPLQPHDLNFAPVILGRKTVLNMNMIEWHKIHRVTQATLNNRSSRAMYEQPFSIQLDKDNESLQMFFLTFTITTRKGEDPEFLNPVNIDPDKLFLILSDFERFLKRHVPGTDWVVLPFGTVNETVSNAFDFYQLLLAENLISQHSQNFKCHYALIPTNNQYSFVLIVWNKDTNNVLSALLLNPYSKDLNEVVSDVLDLLNKYYVEALYIGDEEIPFDHFNNLTKIDFASYLKKFGASVLKPE